MNTNKYIKKNADTKTKYSLDLLNTHNIQLFTIQIVL